MRLLERPAVRIAVGVIALMALIIAVAVMYGSYVLATSPSAKTTTPSKEGGAGSKTTTESSPATTPVVANTTTHVIVLIEGLNFRKEPAQDSVAIAGLKKGQRLTLVESTKNWYKVRDEDGRVGWVSSNPGYVKLEK